MTKNNPWALIKRARKGFDSNRVDPKSKFDFFWAISKDGQYQFFIQHKNLEDWPTKKITLSGIDIQQFQTSTGFRLALSLCEINDWDIFYILCDDLLQASDNSQEEKGMLNIVYNRLLRWQKLFRKRGKKLLTEQEQQGLIGELYFLKYHLLTEFSDTEALSFWRGPFREDQDFGIGSSAIEVKSKQGTSAPYIQISSISQLDPQLEYCFLYVVTLNSAPHSVNDAFSLNKIIEEIKHSLSDTNDIDAFEHLLSEVGYMDLPEYSDKSYLISKESVFEVKEDFPRLKAKDMPIGVDSVNYRIEIKECNSFSITLDEFRQRIISG